MSTETEKTPEMPVAKAPEMPLPEQNATAASAAEAQKLAAVAPNGEKQNDKTREITEAERVREMRRAKKGAYWAFHLTNFIGLHFLFNSTTSLFIAYNLLPTKPAKALMGWVAKIATPVNAGWAQIVTPVKKLIHGAKFKPIPEEELAGRIAHSARSRVETAFMCIAGFLALWPVKYLEDHRAQFMNTVDHWLHPGKSKEERAKTDLNPKDMPKETWWNLTIARFVGLAFVFSADALQQRFNNLLTYEKGNIDTAVWKWGANVSEKMNSGVRNWLVNFFSRKGITLSSIQTDINPGTDMRLHLLNNISAPQEMKDVSRKMSEIQHHILKTTDKAVIKKLEAEVKAINDGFFKSHPHMQPQLERAVFAEQSRLLLTKEVFLTLLISTVIYVSAKAPFMSRFYEKIGLKKKHKAGEPESDEIRNPLLEDHMPSLEESPNIHDKYSSKVKPREREELKPSAYAERVSNEPNHATQVST